MTEPGTAMNTRHIASMLLPLALMLALPASAQSVSQLQQENSALKARVQFLQQQVSALQLALQDAKAGMPGTASDGPAGPPPIWNPKDKAWTLVTRDNDKKFYFDPKSVRSATYEGVRYVRADFRYVPTLASGTERLTTEAMSYSDCVQAKRDVAELRTVRSDGARLSAEVSFDPDKAISDSIGSAIARKLCELRP